MERAIFDRLFSNKRRGRAELAQVFPGRLEALKEHLGVSHNMLRQALGASAGQYSRYQKGESLPACVQLLTLFDLAYAAGEGAVDILRGATEKAIDLATEAQRGAECRHARRKSSKQVTLGTGGVQWMTPLEFGAFMRRSLARKRAAVQEEAHRPRDHRSRASGREAAKSPESRLAPQRLSNTV